MSNSVNEGNQKVRAGLASKIAWQYIQEGAYDSAIAYYRLAVVKEAADASKASSYNGLGVSYSALGMADSAISAYTSGLQLYRDLRDTAKATIIHTNLAILYKNKGLYDKSLDHAFYAARFHERSNNIQALASSFNTISLVYLKLNDPEHALSYGRKALSLRHQIEYRKGIAQSFSNLGEIWLSLNQHDSALFYLERAHKLKLALKDDSSIASTLNNLGNLYQRLGKYDEALRFYHESLTRKDQSRDLPGQAVTWNNVARVQVKLKLPNAEESLLRAESLIRQTGMLEELHDNLQMQAEVFREKNRFSEAFAVTSELIGVKDSILNKQKAEAMADLLVNYETEKKEQEISLLLARDRAQRAELAARRLQIYGLLAGLIFLGALAFLVYWNLRLARQSKDRISLLLKELHHRVKNNLQLLSSVFSLQSQYLKEPSAVLAVRSSESRVNAMALIHKKLYDGIDDRSVYLKDYVTELMQYLLNAYGFSESAVYVDIDIPSVRIDVDKAIPIGLIINELVSNSFKYAFPDQDNPTITIRFRMERETMKLEIRDNGRGFETPGKREVNHSFGLRMVNLLVRQLKGNYETDTRSGTAYILTLPI
jgi:two-component system, sensor histidine kinase PdtaS